MSENTEETRKELSEENIDKIAGGYRATDPRSPRYRAWFHSKQANMEIGEEIHNGVVDKPN